MSSALTRALRPVLDRIDALERRLSLVPAVWDATVTSTSPLRIQRDAETAPLASTPESLVPVGQGDRVRVLHWGTRYLILGRATTGADLDSGWVDIEVTPPFTRQGTLEPEVRRIGSLVMTRWGWSSTGMSALSSHNVGLLPDQFRPTRTVYAPVVSSNAASIGVLIVHTSGIVQIRTGSSVGSYYLLDGTTWTID